MNDSRVRIYVALALALIPAAAAAQSQAPSFASCSATEKAPDSKSPSGPDVRDAASSKSSAFGQGSIDMFSLSSQDPLTRRAVSEETQRAVKPEPEPSHWRIASAPPSSRPKAPAESAPPALDEPYASGSWVLEGSPRDADRVPIRDASMVSEEASGSVEGFTKSPSLYSELNRMSSGARRAAQAVDAQQAHGELQRLWGNPALPEASEPPANDGTKFFNIR